jgi:hypothetical protein
VCDDQVIAHMTTKYLTSAISEDNRTYNCLFDNFQHEHAYPNRGWKNGSLGAKDEKWPGECLDVDDGVLILWLNMDQKMDTRSSQN